MKNEIAITLIALVITIIVMVILAGVGITISLNVINKAKYAGWQNEIAAIEEQVELKKQNQKYDEFAGENVPPLFEEKLPEGEINNLSQGLVYEIMYEREGKPESKVPTEEYYGQETLPVEEGSIKDLFYVEKDTSRRRRKSVFI